MQNLRSRLLITALVVPALAGALAGCGADSHVSHPTPTSSQPAAGAPTATHTSTPLDSSSGGSGCALVVGLTVSEAAELTGLQLKTRTDLQNGCRYQGAPDEAGLGDSLQILLLQIPNPAVARTVMDAQTAPLEKQCAAGLASCVWVNDEHTIFHADSDTAGGSRPLFMSTALTLHDAHLWHIEVQTDTAAKRSTAVLAVMIDWATHR